MHGIDVCVAQIEATMHRIMNPQKYQNKKFRSNIGISAVPSDVDIGVGLLPHTYIHTVSMQKTDVLHN